MKPEDIDEWEPWIGETPPPEALDLIGREITITGQGRGQPTTGVILEVIGPENAPKVNMMNMYTFRFRYPQLPGREPHDGYKGEMIWRDGRWQDPMGDVATIGERRELGEKRQLTLFD